MYMVKILNERRDRVQLKRKLDGWSSSCLHRLPRCNQNADETFMRGLIGGYDPNADERRDESARELGGSAKRQ